jgi:hypothetical protein
LLLTSEKTTLFAVSQARGDRAPGTIATYVRTRMTNMFRKITTIAAAALAIGSLTIAPHIANATTLPVEIDVPSTATITATTPPPTDTSWTGAAPDIIDFTVSVLSNDSLGYKLTFTSANSTASPAFDLMGTVKSGSAKIVYTVASTDSGTVAYGSGVPGPTLGLAAPGTSTWNFALSTVADPTVVADAYTDTITAVVSTN